MLHNENLETFVVVSEVLSFNKAAEKLYVTPSAVIKQIKTLEKEYEKVFFLRSPRGLSLTEEGIEFLQYAKTILKISFETEQKIRNKNDDWTINVCHSVHTPTYKLKETFEQVQKLYPQLKINIVPFDTDLSHRLSNTVFSMVGINYDVVMGVVDASKVSSYKNVELLNLVYTRIRLAMSVNNPLSEKQTLTLADLKKQKVLLYGYNYYSVIPHLKNFLDKDKSISSIINDKGLVDLYNECANSNNLLTTCDVWDTLHPLTKVVKIDWPFFFTFGILYQKNPPKKVKLFLEALKRIYNIET